MAFIAAGTLAEARRAAALRQGNAPVVDTCGAAKLGEGTTTDPAAGAGRAAYRRTCRRQAAVLRRDRRDRGRRDPSRARGRAVRGLRRRPGAPDPRRPRRPPGALGGLLPRRRARPAAGG